MARDWIVTLARGLTGRARPEAAERAAPPGMLWATLAAFVAVLALELVVEDREAAAAFLLIVPVGVVTLLYGSRMGLIAAAAAFAVAFGQTQLEDVATGVAGYLTRAVVFLSVPVIVGIALTRGRSQAGDPHLSSEGEAAARSNGRPGCLTKREIEILRLLALGHTNKEIADQLYLSPRTVESHRANIQGKLRRSGRAELVRYALQHGLIGGGSEGALVGAGRR
jgi:DNA-binding CsgD family transcriptional regulator